MKLFVAMLNGGFLWLWLTGSYNVMGCWAYESNRSGDACCYLFIDEHISNNFLPKKREQHVHRSREAQKCL
jgi:hypothetical protein